MKKLYTFIVLAVALLLATSAFASNRGSIQFSQEVQIAGTRLSPGQYSLEWEGKGPQVELKVMRGGKVVATTPAQMVDLQTASVGDQTIVSKGADGTNSLSEIRFSGKKYALQIGSETARMSTGN